MNSMNSMNIHFLKFLHILKYLDFCDYFEDNALFYYIHPKFHYLIIEYYKKKKLFYTKMISKYLMKLKDHKIIQFNNFFYFIFIKK